MLERLRTGVDGIDGMLKGGIPKGFLVCVAGEPGTGKTVFCLHYVNQGLVEGGKAIYVTTEEDVDSVIEQADQFNMELRKAYMDGRLVIIDFLGKGEWSLSTLDVESLILKIVEAKKRLGYGHMRCAIDSLSAFWLDKPAMARHYSYQLKKRLQPWHLTIIAVTQYAVTTSQAFGFGLEHVADGIIRFIRTVRAGRLHRYVIVEKMRNTNHDLRLHSVNILDGRGMTVKPLPVVIRREDTALPGHVYRQILEAYEQKERMIP